MPQTSSVSIVISRHSGQLCRCFFTGELDVSIFETSQRGTIFAFISTMSLNDSGNLGVQDGASAITQESNVNAKLERNFIAANAHHAPGI
jgi:hypothetical protein